MIFCSDELIKVREMELQLDKSEADEEPDWEITSSLTNATGTSGYKILSRPEEPNTSGSTKRKTGMCEFQSCDEIKDKTENNTLMNGEPNTFGSRKRKADICKSQSSDRLEVSTFNDKTEKTFRRKKIKTSTSLLDLVMENHEKYNRFITNKVPKLLKQLGVDSSESEWTLLLKSFNSRF